MLVPLPERLDTGNRLAPDVSLTRTASGVSWVTAESSQRREDTMIATSTDLAAEALFASALQPSQSPSFSEVRSAVTETLLRLGSQGCAAAVAAEFGDHPETAVARMGWARQLLGMGLSPLAAAA